MYSSFLHINGRKSGNIMVCVLDLENNFYTCKQVLVSSCYRLRAIKYDNQSTAKSCGRMF